MNVKWKVKTTRDISDDTDYCAIYCYLIEGSVLLGISLEYVKDMGKSLGKSLGYRIYSHISRM